MFPTEYGMGLGDFFFFHMLANWLIVGFRSIAVCCLHGRWKLLYIFNDAEENFVIEGEKLSQFESLYLYDA